MKKLLLLYVFLSMPCYGMTHICPAEKNIYIDSLITQLSINPKIIRCGAGTRAYEQCDPNHLFTLAKIIDQSKIDPLLKNKVKKLFKAIEPLYINELPDNRANFRKTVINKLQAYLFKMVSIGLLSENLSSLTSKKSKKYTCNNEYFSFLSDIKTYCWNKYKNNLQMDLAIIGFSGLQLTVIQYGFENIKSERDQNFAKLFSWVSFIMGTGLGCTKLLQDTTSYIIFRENMSKLNQEDLIYNS